MKKQIILFLTISILIMLLTACASSQFSSSQIPGDAAAGHSPSQELEQDEPPAGAEHAEEVSTPAESELPYSETSGGAEPAEEFSTAQEAAEHIIAVKAAGVEETVSPNHVGLYDKEHIYALKEPPLPGYEQTSIMITLSGTAILYDTDDYKDRARFFWFQGYESDEKVEERISRFNLKRYKDTKFFFGELHDDVYILWWEHGDEFELSYPADTNIAPEDVIERIEVEKYDV